MTELDRLPPDQRAVLSLVLDRGKSYAEVAEMLAIPESAVRQRAHAALDALAEDASGAGGPVARAPVGTAAASSGAARRNEPGAAAAPPRRPRDPWESRAQAASMVGPGSRLAGALLLGGIVAVIVVAVILISGSGGAGKSSSNPTTGASSTAATTTSASKPTLDKTIALSAPEPSLPQSGKAYVLSEGARRAFYISAQGLPPSSGFFYAVWLYNSPSSSAPLGRAPSVGSDGRMQGGNPLPSNANLYHQLIVTRETSTHPSHPGPIVLHGTFGLH